MVLELGKGDRPTPRQRMGRGHAQHALDLPERLSVEVGMGVVVLHDHQVGLVLLEPVLNPLQKLDLELDPGRDPFVGHGLEGGQHRLEGQNAVENDREPGLPPLDEFARQRLDPLRLGQDPAPLGEHGLPRRGERDPIPLTIEVGDAELLLESAELITDGGLDLVEPGGGPGEATLADYRVEGLEGVEIESQPFTFFEGDTVERYAFFPVRSG